MVDITKYRSNSLSSLYGGKQPELRILSDLAESSSRRAQSSDSLLSLSQNISNDPDTCSQISLPEYNGTVIDSEGYASFRSNLSSNSSPFSSNQTSPIGDGDGELLIDSLAEELVEKHSDDSHHWRNNLIPCNRDESGNLSSAVRLRGKGTLSRGEELDLEDTVDYDEAWKSSSEGRKLTGNSQNPSLYFNGADDNPGFKSHLEEYTSNDSMPALEPLLLDRRMSTIEECYEETPSPRSFVEIDKSFNNAYRRNIWQSTPKTLSDLRDEKERRAETRVYECWNKLGDLESKSPAKGAQTLGCPGVKNCSEMPGTTFNVQVGRNDGEGVWAVKENKTANGCESLLSQDKSLPDVLGSEAEVCMDRLELRDLSVLSDQVFDIDLDLYDIPYQRRQSLEIKLSDLRRFVDGIIADRQCLEKDRLFLQETLQMIEGQRCGSILEKNDVCTKTREKNGDVEKQQEGTAKREGYVKSCLASPRAVSKACGAESTLYTVDDERSQNETHDDFLVEKKPPSKNSDFEELLCDLEDALLENIELKHMNKDLTSANEELRGRIEELLIDEEELRCKLNEVTLKLMEDGERQKEENCVLRSNFNKVLREYNSLEVEFKELEKNYEELIAERDLLADELTVKNEDYILCKDECSRLMEELDQAKSELENYRQVDGRVWTRSDWEEWTVLQSKISSTELALFDARKQKAQVVNDLKRLKKLLECGKEKIEDTEKSIAELEKSLKRAQARNESLQSENAELRCSILDYEVKLAKFEKLAEEQLLKEDGKFAERNFRFSEESGLNVYEDWIDMKAKDFEDDKLIIEGEFPVEEDGMNNVTTLHGDAVKSGNILRSRTFSLNDMDTLALKLLEEKSIPTDTYADGQYQNAFQEIDEKSNTYLSDNDSPSTMACASANTFAVANDITDDSKSSVKKRHRSMGFSFKGLLPSVLQSIITTKAKKGKRGKSSDKATDNINEP